MVIVINVHIIRIVIMMVLSGTNANERIITKRDPKSRMSDVSESVLPPARIWIQMEIHRRVEAAHSNHCNSPNSQLLCKRSVFFFKFQNSAVLPYMLWER